jgi:hypothetical protein
MQIYCQTQCWVIGDLSDEEGLVRVSSDTSDFHIEKDTYTGVDSECTILKVEKLAEKCAKMPPGLGRSGRMANCKDRRPYRFSPFRSSS